MCSYNNFSENLESNQTFYKYLLCQAPADIDLDLISDLEFDNNRRINPYMRSVGQIWSQNFNRAFLVAKQL